MPDDKQNGPTATVEPQGQAADGKPVATTQATDGKPATQKAPEKAATDANGGERNQQPTQKQGDAPKGDDLPKGAKIAFFDLREKKRKAEEAAEATRAASESQIRERDAEIKRLREQLASSANGTVSADPLEDPKEYARQLKESISADFRREREELQFTENLARNSAEAEKWLLTRTHLKDPNFAQDVKSLIDGKFAHLAHDPQSAATMAYIEAARMRGVNPELDISQGADDGHVQRGGGARPSSPPIDGGQKVWTRAEIRRALDNATPGSDESRSLLAEVKKAEREGRVR